MEAIQHEQVKESRTQKLLRELKVPADFGDPALPKGFFSHSQYVSWKICGKAYEFKYVLQEKTPNYAPTTRGTAVHAGIEYALKAKLLKKEFTLEQAREVVSKTFDREAENVLDWGKDDNDQAVDPGKIKDQAMKLFEAFAVHALPKINPLGVEKGFAKKFGDVPVVGWIDLIDEQPAMAAPGMTKEQLELAPKKRVTADTKTGRAKWSEHELRTDTQLTLYSGVEGTPDVRVDQLLAQKKGCTYVRGESVRTPQDVTILTEDINEVAGFVKKGVFPMACIDHWACNALHCSFWHLCRGRKR
jgi:hypothetical protein